MKRATGQIRVPDVIVIGAGVAGLAATAELSRRGYFVVVLEARERIGGRILTRRDATWDEPIELGAEFVHGGNREVFQTLRRAGLRTEHVPTLMWWREGGGLQRVADFWPRVGRVADLIPARRRGWSFDDFLTRYGDKISGRDRERTRGYVQSFNAAPAGLISAQAIREDRAGADNEDRRVVGGYDRLPESLASRWPEDRVALHLGSPVTEVKWRRGHVSVRVSRNRAAADSYDARAVIITLPLGVLRAGVVRFNPRLKAKESLVARMGWGNVQRVVVRLRDSMWSNALLPKLLRGRRGRDFGFVNTPGATLPVWWAPSPPRPVLVGWAGGPLADALVGVSRPQMFAAIVDSLAQGFGASPRGVRAVVEDWLWHDWTDDPFACGAYSFPAAGAEAAAEELAAPQASTVFFAGEATSDIPGTVHGALQSGKRAAREVTRALER